MSNTELFKKLIHTTLTLNSTTLFTYENHQLAHLINNLNCSEVISQELGLINASKTLVGSIPITTGARVTNTRLLLYFMKKVFSNTDGSSDLITVVVIAHTNVSKTLILTILKKITDKYIDFKKELGSGNDPNQLEQAKARLGEFKLYMNQIIKFEEMNFDSNQSAYNYGSTNRGEGSDETDGLLGNSESINPNQLLLANEEVDEVRQLMLDNINKLLSRGDKINRLVDQTDRLTTSSSVFQKKAQQIKRNMWLAKTKFYLLVGGGAVLLLYLVAATSCGFPFFNRCLGN